MASSRPSLKYPVTEEQHQILVIAWAMVNQPMYPQLAWLHHIPNGTVIGDSAKWAMGKLNKQMGVKSGVPDLFLPWYNENMAGLYIEMKKPSGHLDPNQKVFADFITHNPLIDHCVCYGFVEAIEKLKAYLGGLVFKPILVEGVEYGS